MAEALISAAQMCRLSVNLGRSWPYVFTPTSAWTHS